jgi:hypothetical protein
MRAVAVVLVAFVSIAASTDLVAQERPLVEVRRMDLQQLEREFEENTVRLGRLRTMQFRRALGLRVDAEQFFVLTDVERASSIEQLHATLQHEEAELTRLATREADMRRNFDTRRKALAERLDAGMDVDAVLTPRPAFESPRSVARSVPDAAAPSEVPVTAPQPKRPPAASAGPVLIKGSTDHAIVGRALFRAERFDEARAELELVVKDPKTADLADVFLLAQCRERLRDVAGAETLYLTIVGRDEIETPQGVKSGTWARTARSAMQHMRWMDDKGDWRPAVPVEALRPKPPASGTPPAPPTKPTGDGERE